MIICVKLLLKPRRFNYKKLHKQRKVVYSNSRITLNFGSCGLLLLQPLQLSSKRLIKFKLFLKRAVRKSDKTKRFFWFNGFPHLPLTRKPLGSRMGKGKGKVEIWFAQLKPGSFLFEFVNLRHGRALYFFKQMMIRLQVPSKPVFKNSFYLPLPTSNSQKFFLTIFW